MSRKPACATDEYASNRFTSVCVTPTIAPTAIVRIATAHMMGRQSQLRPPNATKNTRINAPNAAILVPAAMNPVIDVGAP